MQIVDWFLDLFTVANLAYFVLGGTVTYAYHIVKARMTSGTVIIRWQYFAAPLAAGIVLNVALQTQQNADCVREFQQVLRARSEITTQNDDVSQKQRMLVYGWIHNLIFPPPDIAGLDPQDPRRQKYGLELTQATDREFADLIKLQDEYDRQRAQHTLPPATCGE